MATNAPTRMYGPAAPGTVTGALYTVPGGSVLLDVITSITLANTTGTAATVTLGIGGTAAANQIMPTVSIPANTAIVVVAPFVIATGEAVHGIQGTAAAVTVTLNGYRRST